MFILHEQSEQSVDCEWNDIKKGFFLMCPYIWRWEGVHRSVCSLSDLERKLNIFRNSKGSRWKFHDQSYSFWVNFGWGPDNSRPLGYSPGQKMGCFFKIFLLPGFCPQTYIVSLDWTKICGPNWQFFDSTAEKQQKMC